MRSSHARLVLAGVVKYAAATIGGGLVRTTIRTAMIGASTVFGGFLGRGFLRSWRAGYERVRDRYATLRAHAARDGSL